MNNTNNKTSSSVSGKKIYFLKIFLIGLFLFAAALIGNNTALSYDVDLSGDVDYSGNWGGNALNNSISVQDQILQRLTTEYWSEFFTQKIQEKTTQTSASRLFHSTLSQALNTIAFDTATWLGSGGKGQKPMFITEGWGQYLTNVADNAAGKFIEELGKLSGSAWGVKFNLCEPDFALKIKIGLGLRQYAKPLPPACTFSKMTKNWQRELRDPNFLSKFQDMFNPTSNDLGIALTLHTNVIKDVSDQVQGKAYQRQENKGWLDLRNIGGLRDEYPGYSENMAKLPTDQFLNNIGKITGDVFVDAANIFLNQLALTLVQEQLKKLGGKRTTEDFDWSQLANPDAGRGAGGIAAARETLKRIVEPRFNVRGDYKILGELTQCPDPNKAGPTNCVIDDRFSQSIQKKMTVGRAIKEGYLNPNGAFGFTLSGLEPSYIEGYPYRSMIILRKFRILPVGWEVAAQYIKDNPDLVEGVKNLGDLVACFNSDDDYAGYDQAWCRGLVDPNWVLKAPQNYCRREGPGPEILTANVSGSGNDSELSITRNDKYCADEQSCVKENPDGSCQLYGYCTEERRKWSFDAKSCDPKYNTCETFKTSDGKSLSILENTLDYGDCSIDNAGCRAYCKDYDYASSTFACTTTSVGDKIYLDRDAETCDARAEGCREFVRARIGYGANLLLNSGFEEDLAIGGWSALGATSSTAYEGAGSLALNSGALTKAVTVGPATYSIGGDVFSLSFYSRDCDASSTFRIAAGGPDVNFASGSNWQYNQTSYVLPTSVGGNNLDLYFNVTAAGCLVDAVKLEHGYKPTAYNEYASNPKIYQKLLPDYLVSECYDAAGNIRPTAPPECQNFVRQCRAEEVGCELFTSASDNMSVPAKVVAQDYCVAECVGYDTYLQTESAFDSTRPENFIPKTAQVCGAAAAGCDQFTNLDEVARGGEGIEYYSTLRQCIKPDPVACGDFYTWEGSSDTGFQLRVASLNFQNGADGTPDPRVTEDDSALCDETIYNLAPTDPNYNSDCREYYNSSGVKRYHLSERTIACSDDCHPYRRTEKNIEPTVAAATDCANLTPSIAGDSFWDPTIVGPNKCIFCKGGGSWSPEHNACIYQAIPKLGKMCVASQAGCREYTGSSGRNERIVINHDFEDGTRQGWIGSGTALINLSNESVIMGGHSMSAENGGLPATAVLTISGLIQTGKSYVLSFIAKSATTSGATTLAPAIVNGAGAADSFGSIAGLSGDWQYYQVNLARVLNQTDAGEKLTIAADGNFYLDNLRLTEIVDRYYLIKNSWRTPEVCDRDINGNPFAGYMLGCDEYSDRENETHYLKSFSYLCSDSAVGCELAIDTKNSASPAAESFNGGAPADDDVNVPADEYVYVVYDKKKQCNAEDRGCERLGLPYNYDGSVVYRDAYLKNDPDKYDKALCTVSAAGCDEYSAADGLEYFKNPGDQLCEWRQSQSSWGWYRKKINRCDTDADGEVAITDPVCLKDADCAGGLPTSQAGQKCLLETVDQACSTDWYKTFGFGGPGNRVTQPSAGWAGTCPAEFAGCSELIDPVSLFAPNLIFNGDFQDIDGSGGLPSDGWAGGAGPFSQPIKLEAYTLYRLAGTDPVTLPVNRLMLDCTGSFYELDASNLLSWRPAGPGPEINLNLDNQTRSALFYSDANAACTVSVAYINDGFTKVELKKTAVDYQLARDLDKKACSGTVNFDDGCVLFDERVQNGASLAGMTYDADRSSSTPFVSSDETRDSNSLIKVSPDRVCDKWLACKSKVVAKNEKGEDESYCYDVGLCNGLDENNNCSSFLLTKETDQTYPTYVGTSQIGNFSGYAKAGYQTIGAWREPNDYYLLAAMEQTGETTNFTNGNFEFAGRNDYPIGWTYEPPTAASKQVWDSSIFKVIDNPVTAQQEGIKYPMEGRNFLKLGSTFNANSESIDVAPGTYVVSAYINTKNASQGIAEVVVLDGINVIPITPAIELAAGNDWTFKLGSFYISAASGISKVRIQTRTKNNPIGNFYFDAIAIKPALESKDLTPANLLDDNSWYAPSSCRLYPASDSLSCDYYSPSGQRQVGWSGYCLEHDRYPGSSDACLLWWPVDKVKGQGIEEGGGYNGRFPLYYCALSTLACGDKSYCKKVVQTVTPTGANKYWNGRVFEGSDYVTAGTTSQSYVYSSDSRPFGAVMPPSPANNPFEWDSDPATQIFDPLYILPASSNQARQGQAYEYDRLACNQTFSHWMSMGRSAADLGDLGYWDQCVFNGYSDDTPAPSWCAQPYEPPEFGGRYQLIVTANVGGTPTDPSTICKYGLGYWDTPIGKYWVSWGADGDGGRGTRFTASETCNSSSTKPGPADEILERMFAQSYDAWEWKGFCQDTNKNICNVAGEAQSCVGDADCGPCGAGFTCQDMRYRATSSPSWLPPDSLCWGGARPAYDPVDKTCAGGDCFACPGPTCDWCAVPPTISNVRINNVAAADVSVSRSGLVNLTFNSRVDSQQLPLVMYEVRWGDGESTLVSGVEMRDRPNADNPHSLYHLYNFWDLKSKDNLPNPDYAGISCGASSCTITPQIRIKDNWGWCNGDDPAAGRPRGSCSQFEAFGADIVVTEN